MKVNVIFIVLLLNSSFNFTQNLYVRDSIFSKIDWYVKKETLKENVSIIYLSNWDSTFNYDKASGYSGVYKAVIIKDSIFEKRNIIKWEFNSELKYYDYLKQNQLLIRDSTTKIIVLIKKPVEYWDILVAMTSKRVINIPIIIGKVNKYNMIYDEIIMKIRIEATGSYSVNEIFKLGS